MHLLVLLRLIPIKVQDHLLPLLQHPNLTHLTLVRREPAVLENPKVSQHHLVNDISESVPEYTPLQQIGKVIQLFWMALRITRREQPDAVYGIYLIPYGVYAWLIARLTGKKCIVSLIGTDFNKDVLELPLRRFWQWILKRMDVVTVFDETARQKLLALHLDPQKVLVLPHAIDMTRCQRDDSASIEYDAIYTGHLWELKEVKRIVAAWKTVVDACPQAKLAILGEGETRASLERQAAELGISDHVFFTGWVKEVPAWLSRARIFINLSSEEGVPMSMLEAMACGLVPVVTDVGGVASVVQDGINGYLVAHPANPELVADRILHLLNDENLYRQLQQKSLEVRQRYSYEAVSAWWQPILERLRS